MGTKLTVNKFGFVVVVCVCGGFLVVFVFTYLEVPLMMHL